MVRYGTVHYLPQPCPMLQQLVTLHATLMVSFHLVTTKTTSYDTYATNTNTTYPMPLCYHKATVGLMLRLLKQGAPRGGREACNPATHPPKKQIKKNTNFVDTIRRDSSSGRGYPLQPVHWGIEREDKKNRMS
jgi:hypothetical protein